MHIMGKQTHPEHVGINFNSTKPLREKLLREITHLERQLEQLRLDDDGKGIDFSMLQTYKELIQCRRGMLKELPQDQF
tara:strand:+ start:122 stop:355 length:234 start_codon:yes stop_codon:yes gene_type:complete